MRPVVNTEKHIVQTSLFAVGSGAIAQVHIANAVAVPTARQHVREGAKISSVYLEYWVTSDDAAQGSSIISLEKQSGNQTAMSTAESAAMNAYPNKKNVLHIQMGLNGPNTQYPMPAVKGWFKIPKSKQRFGLDDLLVLNFHGQSNGLSICGNAVYKEQY